MKSILAAALMFVPAVAFAAPALSAAPDPARQAKMEKRLHTFRTIGLAEALDLDAGTALQLDAQMSQFDERRKPLHEQLRKSKQILDAAAEGDSAAANQVDQAIAQGFEARTQLEQIDREMLTSISKGMNPQQKAKLAVFLVNFKRQMMEHMSRHGHMGGGHGKFGSGAGQAGNFSRESEE